MNFFLTCPKNVLNNENNLSNITNAVNMVYGKVNCKIEVETETLEQFLEALKTPCDIIMLDNMDNELMAKCVKINSCSLICSIISCSSIYCIN